MAEKTTEELSDQDVELSFNSAIESLQKALDGDSVEGTQSLQKAGSKSKKAPKSYDEDKEDEEEAEEDEEDEEDEDEDKDMGKSVEDILGEDQEAEASMDVEPFLRQLAKAIDKRIDGVQKMQKSIDSKLGSIETLAKAQGTAMVAQAALVKSQADTVQKIAKQDVQTQSIKRLSKARFDGGDSPVEIDGPIVLEKSLEWAKDGKIDLLEAGMIEARVNKGLLGRQDDPLDRKVARLIKEAV